MSRNFELMQQAGRVREFPPIHAEEPSAVEGEVKTRRVGKILDFGQFAREESLRLVQRTFLLQTPDPPRAVVFAGIDHGNGCSQLCAQTAETLASNTGGSICLVDAVLLAVTFLSALWAEMPDLVIRRAIAVAGTTLFGLVVAIRLTFPEQLRLFRWTTRAAAAMCLGVLILAPGAAFSSGPEGGAFRGIFNHKNHLGAAMALGFLIEWFFPETTRKAKLVRGFSLTVYLVLLVFSNSMTSIVAFGTTFLAVYSFRFLYSRLKLPLPLLFTIVLLGAGVAVGIESSAVQLLGRSSDLTGRTELWSFTLSMIAKRPLFGFGYSGFWMGASEDSQSVQTLLDWTPIYSHNGYLEILLSLGLVGLLLVLVIVGTGIKRVLDRARVNDSIQEMWPIAFFTFFLVHNLAECTILLQNCLEWSLCIATVVSSDALLVGALTNDADNTETSRIPAAEYA